MENWYSIYEKISKIAKNYGIRNIPYTNEQIWIYYPHSSFLNSEDYRKLRELNQEIELALKDLKEKNLVIIKFEEDMLRITLIKNF